MIWALFAAFLTKRPPWVQAVVFGLCAGLFVAAAVEANTGDARTRSDVLPVLAVGLPVGGLFWLAVRAQTRRQATPGDTRAWVQVAYVAAWILSVAAGVSVLFGAGGFKVAVLAIVPIVLLAAPALIGIRALLHHPISAAGGQPHTVTPSEAPYVRRA